MAAVHSRSKSGPRSLMAGCSLCARRHWPLGPTLDRQAGEWCTPGEALGERNEVDGPLQPLIAAHARELCRTQQLDLGALERADDDEEGEQSLVDGLAARRRVPA